MPFKGYNITSFTGYEEYKMDRDKGTEGIKEI
jgi:hypothetical protein